MKSHTGAIIGTLAALLLCGLPGLILLCMAASAFVTPPASGTEGAPTYILVAQVCAGLLLILIPAAVGFLTWRRKGTPVSVEPVPANARATVVPTPAPAMPAGPAPSPVTPPAPASAPMAPAVSSFPASPAALDASAQAVRDAIMALNRPSAPYQIVDGTAKGVDLIAEWKIVDAQWYEIFAKANLSKVFRIYMKFDSGKREVRTMDEELTVSWKKGVPSLSAEASFFRGQKSSISFGTGYAFTENLTPGQVYKYKFNTNELKKPIQDAIAACGWTYKGVAFGKL